MLSRLLLGVGWCWVRPRTCCDVGLVRWRGWCSRRCSNTPSTTTAATGMVGWLRCRCVRSPERSVSRRTPCIAPSPGCVISGSSSRIRLAPRPAASLPADTASTSLQLACRSSTTLPARQQALALQLQKLRSVELLLVLSRISCRCSSRPEKAPVMIRLPETALSEISDICTEDAGVVGHPIVRQHAGRVGRRVDVRGLEARTSC